METECMSLENYSANRRESEVNDMARALKIGQPRSLVSACGSLPTGGEQLAPVCERLNAGESDLGIPRQLSPTIASRQRKS